MPSRSFAEEDPTFTELGPETGQTIIGGMGRAFAPDIIVDRVCVANSSRPTWVTWMVAYRETIRKKVEKYEYTHKKQTGGSGPVRVHVLEPLPADSEEEHVRGHRWPRPARVHPRSMRIVTTQSVLDAGYPMVDIKATLLDGSLPRG